jgi:Zn ribbon nucleic-acid-binding protein
MGQQICPGQDTAFWRPGDIFEVECSSCGHEVEFFKDDVSRRCGRCGGRVQNPKLNLGCAQWCEHAAQCLGYDPKEALMVEGEDTPLVDRLIEGIKRAAGDKALGPALEQLERAKQIMRAEPDGLDPKVVLSAAVLARLDAGSATELLDEAKLDAEAKAEVEAILARRASGEAPATGEGRVAADAVRLAAGAPEPGDMLTAPGRELAAAARVQG